MKKIFAFLLTVLMCAACFGGCASRPESDLAYIRDKGTMIVGITDWEPMDYKDENGPASTRSLPGWYARSWGSNANSSSCPTGIRSSTSWRPRIST